MPTVDGYLKIIYAQKVQIQWIFNILCNVSSQSRWRQQQKKIVIIQVR